MKNADAKLTGQLKCLTESLIGVVAQIETHLTFLKPVRLILRVGAQWITPLLNARVVGSVTTQFFVRVVKGKSAPSEQARTICYRPHFFVALRQDF